MQAAQEELAILEAQVERHAPRPPTSMHDARIYLLTSMLTQASWMIATRACNLLYLEHSVGLNGGTGGNTNTGVGGASRNGDLFAM